MLRRALVPEDGVAADPAIDSPAAPPASQGGGVVSVEHVGRQPSTAAVFSGALLGAAAGLTAQRWIATARGRRRR